MKKVQLVILLLFSINTLFAQEKTTFTEGGVIICSEFHETRPISEIFKENPVDTSKIYKDEESEDREHRKPQKFRFSVKDGPQYGNDEKTMQTKMGDIPGRAPILNVAGQSATGFRPMDPSGAAGPTHYVQMINSTTFRVYNKSTGVVILTGTFGNLWSPATPNDGDPIVMYDKAADRWFMSQFGQTGNSIYIAISKTNDPTGAYYTYTYTSPIFPDYLKFSVWADGYYMTSNQSTQKVFCFNRAELLAGTPTARSIYVNFSPPKSGFFVPLPGDAADGTLPTYGTPCPIFSYSDNGWGASYSDAVNIYQMSVNWVPTTPTATITLAANVPAASFDASYDASWNDVSQPGTTQKLDGIGGVCMYRAQWKSWSGYNTILLNWGVKISSTQRSIKWCELRQNQSTNVWSMYQEGIYIPDADTRWMGGIAMDNNGSIGLSYMKSNSTTIYPGIYYAGRRSCDPLGTLPIAEVVAIAGLGSQTGGVNRVGDYAQTTLDPDGITFWHTSEYMGSGGTAKTQIFSYQLASCGTNASVSIVQTTGTNPQCPGASATFTATPFNGGTTPVYQWQVNGTNVGTNSTTYTTTSLTNGQIVTCIMTSNLPGVTGSPATSNAITMTVNSVVTPSVSISLTSGSNPTCANSPLTFTAVPTNGGSTPSYQWKVNGTNAGTNSSTFTTSTLTNGQIVTCVLTSNAICVTSSTATSNAITVTVNSLINPTVSILQTAGSNPQCTGASATFTATVSNGASPVYQWKVNGTNVGTNSSTYTTTTLTTGQIVTCVVTATPNCPSIVNVQLGTTATTNPTTGISTADLGNPYPTYYGNGRQQYLIRASELIALGLSAGNINSIGFNVAGTTGNPVTLNGYTINIGTTASTVTTTTFLIPSPAFTTVFGPVNYTPTLNAINTHTFSSPFSWNGSSNILIDICFSNGVVGTVAYQVYQSTSSFVSTTYYQIDNPTSTTCTQTTGTSGSKRPNFYISSGSSTSTATSNGITMTVNSTVAPTVSIALTSGTNPQCTGTSTTFTATPTNGGATPSYQWQINGGNVGTNSPTYTTSSLTNGQIVTCIMTSSSGCASPATATSNGITMIVSSPVTPTASIAVTAGSNPQCAGASVTFTATPTNGGTTPSYQWFVNSSSVGTNSPTFTTTALTNGQVVNCIMTSNAACASPTTALSNNITMTVNPIVTPSVFVSLTAGTNPECAGASTTFTAAPTNGGTTPSYQWKIAGGNVGTNSPTFTTSSLTNGQAVSCVMTSNEACASPLTGTSNNITMVVNPVVTPAVTIGITAGTNPQCSGASVTFTATPTNGGTTPSYQWLVDGANAGTNSATFTSSALTNGQVVSCVMTSNAACASPLTATSNGITMSVGTAVTPSVSIALTTGTNPECAGASATFTATPTNGGGTPSYQWLVDGANAGTNSATFTTTSLTNGQAVSCVMTTSAACPSSASATSNEITMTVNASPTAAVSIALTSGTNPECSGSSATFTATPTNGGTTPVYQWLVNGVNAGTNSENFTSSTLNDNDVVSCLMTSNEFCVSANPATSNAITMTVNAVTAAGVSIAADPGNTICSGTSVAFTATPVNGGVTPSYQWKIDGTNAGTNSSSFTSTTLNNGETITCEIISDKLCVTGNPATSNPIAMTVTANVTAGVSIAADPGNTICSGTSVTFTATPDNGGTTPVYLWKNGTTIVGTNSSTYTTSSLANGNAITCEMTSNEACVSGSPATSNTLTMTVNPILTAGVSIAASPGNTICAGTNVTFTATPSNEGSSPVYQWKNGTTIVGTNSSTYSSNSLASGEVITCEMTSNEICVMGNPATSNSISMTVNAAPVINSFTPASGIPGGIVTINGSGFTGMTSTDFNGQAAAFSIVNDNQVTATIPAGATTGLINITTPCGTANSSVNFDVTASITLNVEVLIEGFYLGGGQMVAIISPTLCDTIVVELASPVSPFSILYTQKGTINTTGHGTFEFPVAAMGNSYYVVIKHRNTLETWSDSPVLMSGPVNSYDFTTAINKAYGSNQINIGGQFAIRSGDVNQDGIINLVDLQILELGTQLFSSGYIPEDLNGDDLVESSDYSIIENNLNRITMRP